MRNRLNRTDHISAAPATVRWPLREPIRWDLVRRMRAKIARGEFETPERTNTTVEKILGALRG